MTSITAKTAIPVQGPFSGVIKIVRFNLRFCLGSALALLAASALLASSVLPRPIHLLVFAGAVLATFWTISSLAVSWYVYDFAGVTRWAWIKQQLPIHAPRWANIHAGLDESTHALRRIFPNTDGVVIDIFDATEMTEPSIARARALCPATEPFLTGRSDALPLPNQDRDTVFLLFAAHEVRDPGRRTQLLREAARALQPGGRLVLVEHLRDWKNFAAFGPGFLHFHSGPSWHRTIREAELQTERESSLTPFVRCFLLRKVAA